MENKIYHYNFLTLLNLNKILHKNLYNKTSSLYNKQML
ncbi:hypothetical protein CDS [Salmonella enterica subsp. enterica serovar Derby]|nr:hypothetical protein CDS [Salmonella enterica subsp. enterica serovar Derby]